MGCRLKCIENEDNHMCCLECPEFLDSCEFVENCPNYVKEEEE